MAEKDKYLKQAFSAFELGELNLKNRFIKTATYEGFYKNGIPGPGLIDFHKGVAIGEIAMTTLAYGAVSDRARTHDQQLYLHSGVIGFLEKFNSEIHALNCRTSIQLTHCGFFSKNKSPTDKSPLSASRVFNAYGLMSGQPFSRAMTYNDIRKTIDDFGKAAEISLNVGFDAIELHMGHGYLLSQFLSPSVNRRKDQYGGSLENRMRFPLEVYYRIREVTGDAFPILCKINLEDGFKGGLQINEAVHIAKKLEKEGINALILSGGYTSKTPFFLMRGDVPLSGMIQAEKNLLQKVALLFLGPLIIKKYDFSETFFLQQAQKIRESVKMPLIYVGGVCSSVGINEIMKSGFDLMAVGRALIYDPLFIKKVEADPEYVSPCNHCNECIVEMDKSGVRCTLED